MTRRFKDDAKRSIPQRVRQRQQQPRAKAKVKAKPKAIEHALVVESSGMSKPSVLIVGTFRKPFSEAGGAHCPFTGERARAKWTPARARAKAKAKAKASEWG